MSNNQEQECMLLKKNLKAKDAELQKLQRLISHFKEENVDLKDEGESLSEENQKYLDMIIRYSLGAKPGANGSLIINDKWLRRQL